MVNSYVYGEFPVKRGVRRHPLKITALLYLREALLKEQYEKCREIIESAKELGADYREIQNILEVPSRPVDSS